MWVIMKDIWYQIYHPWHWLTYGNNAEALGSVIALGGLLGLYLYVRYTKTIMQATLFASQASSFPVLHVVSLGLVGSNLHTQQLNWRLSNVGKGPAKNITVWRIEEGNQADTLIGKWQTLPWNERAFILGTLFSDESPDKEITIRYPQAADGESFLIILTFEDNVGQIHQFQILSYSVGDCKGIRTYALPPRNLLREQNKIGWRTFKHGFGSQIGVDLNRVNIDGSPYLPGPRPSLVYKFFPFLKQ
jgi:hypothetical protein